MKVERPATESDKLNEISLRLDEILAIQIAMSEDAKRRAQETEEMSRRLESIEQAIKRRPRRGWLSNF